MHGWTESHINSIAGRHLDSINTGSCLSNWHSSGPSRLTVCDPSITIYNMQPKHDKIVKKTKLKVCSVAFQVSTRLVLFRLPLTWTIFHNNAKILVCALPQDPKLESEKPRKSNTKRKSAYLAVCSRRSKKITINFSCGYLKLSWKIA